MNGRIVLMAPLGGRQRAVRFTRLARSHADLRKLSFDGALPYAESTDPQNAEIKAIIDVPESVTSQSRHSLVLQGSRPSGKLLIPLIGELPSGCPPPRLRRFPPRTAVNHGHARSRDNSNAFCGDGLAS